jgi:hypothetical protein
MTADDALRAYLTGGSVLRGHSSGVRTLDAADLAAMRPQAPPRRRSRSRTAAPAAPPVPRASETVAAGVMCFCGQRFGPDQAVEFMIHLRAEVGEDLRQLDRFRENRRRSESTPARKAAKAAQAREKYAASEEYRARRRAAARERMRRKRAAGWKPEVTPEQAERQRQRQNAARAAAGQPCECGCGEMTRAAGRRFRAGHHQRARPGTS